MVHSILGYRRAYFCGTKMQCTLCSMKFTRKIALIVWTRLYGPIKPNLSSEVQGTVTFSCAGALKVSAFMGRRRWIYQMECRPEGFIGPLFLKALLRAFSTCFGYQMCLPFSFIISILKPSDNYVYNLLHRNHSHETYITWKFQSVYNRLAPTSSEWGIDPAIAAEAVPQGTPLLDKQLLRHRQKKPLNSTRMTVAS